MGRAFVLVLLSAALIGCGSSTDGGSSAPKPAQPRSSASAVAKLPNPCRDPKGFARAVRRLEKRSDAEVSPNARRALRLLMQNGAKNCSSLSYTDTITTSK